MRVKAGTVTRRRHKKIVRQTKGFFGTRHKLFRRANEAWMKSMTYAYRDRRNRKRDMRRLWIIRINAAARNNGVSYSRLVHDLKEADIAIDRKMLADLAVNNPEAFAAVVQTARESSRRESPQA